ncbi:sulfatase [Wenyingzhuangia sp. IMCC45574]
MKYAVNFFFVLCIVCFSKTVGQSKPNILFIAIDDLRPELGCYGADVVLSPNIDGLAKEGLRFERAYCQQAICSPSRASLMTGARPETIKVIENFTYFRDLNPDVITLPQHFRNNGYETVYAGKIFHGKYSDEELSWSRQPAVGKLLAKGIRKPSHKFALEKNQKMIFEAKEAVVKKYGEGARKYGLGRGPAYEFANVPDESFDDGYNALLAIETLKELKNSDKPFFLGLGFKKPHLEFIAPKKYWDLYENKVIPLAKHKNPPKDGAKMGLHASFELRARSGVPKYGDFSVAQSINYKKAYLACVSYVDAQLGKVLKALEREGLKENTIVILWTDHGWHLGDMGIWGKATNYEITTRVPMIISTPEMSDTIRGSKTDALVELVDMYPTLTELAGLPMPNHLEGQSFVPLLSAPKQQWKKAAFSQFPSPALREWAANPLSKGMRETYFGPLIVYVENGIKKQLKGAWNRDLFENRLMGYAMRTDRYRMILWKDYTKPNSEPIFVELYDHKLDPDETVNIASKNPKLVKQLIQQFDSGWEGNKARL